MEMKIHRKPIEISSEIHRKTIEIPAKSRGNPMETLSKIRGKLIDRMISARSVVELSIDKFPEFRVILKKCNGNVIERETHRNFVVK